MLTSLSFVLLAQKNCSLLAKDNVGGQRSQRNFPPNGGYWTCFACKIRNLTNFLDENVFNQILQFWKEKTEGQGRPLGF